MRVNVSLDDDFLKEIDYNAERLHLSRSAMISMLCAFALMMPNGITKLKSKAAIFRSLEKIAKGAEEEPDLQ